MATIFVKPRFLTRFGDPSGQIGVKKGQLPTSLKIHPPRSCKFVNRGNLSWEIWYCHLFKTNCKFWLFLGQPGGQMVVTKVKKCQTCWKNPIKIEHLHRQMDIFSWKNRWCYLFITYYNFWAFLAKYYIRSLGDLPGSNGIKRCSHI